MVNDSVREELATRISPLAVPAPKPPESKKVLVAKASSEKAKPKESKEIKLKPPPKKIVTKPSDTAEIFIKKTNRTLIEFQTEKTQLPEWRLQLQNVVQQRRKAMRGSTTPVSARTGSATVGLDEYDGENSPNGAGSGMIDAVLPDGCDNQLVANALKRIETSRSKYLIEEVVETPTQKEVSAEKPKPSAMDFPFKIATGPDQTPVAAPVKPNPGPVVTDSKPTLVRKTKAETAKTGYDTNELDPEFVEATASSSFEKQRAEKVMKENDGQTEVAVSKKPETEEEIVESTEADVEEYDDVASFAVRFNSGLFDLIVGSFASLILLAPFMLLGGSWFTASGAFGFLFTLSIVMFIYLTTTIGIFGKSFGMHLFSLEMIDISGEEYPTFHQAAVSSSVYLLSLAFAGLGFLTCLIDEDSRAVHDLASGTIVVKEF